MTLEDLNGLPTGPADAAFRRCCGSARWAAQMTARRAFRSEAELLEAADQIWIALEPKDWLEAFAAHPRIGSGGLAGEPSGAGGERPRPARPFDDAQGRLEPGEGRGWAEQEQSGMQSADAITRERLAQANREYENRFGYIFIVCATGKSADEMLALLEQRLHNAPDRELAIAAVEQSRIARSRLQKLLNE
jgi:OHCU decarboxylase